MSDQVVDTILKDEMQQWLLDCFSDEYDQEQIKELTYSQLKKAINRYYDGGIESFICTVLDNAKIQW